MPQDRPAALVTGSASGIGRAAALRLARAGYDVAINYSRSQDTVRTTLAELDSLGGRHLALRADVSDDDAVAALTAEVGRTFGRLDALVNNAGMTSQTPPEDLDGVDLAEWDRVFAVNVRGLFQVTRGCAPLLRAAGGSVVNVASIVGLRPGPSRSPTRPARPRWSASPARCPGCWPPRSGSTPSRRAGSRASGCSGRWATTTNG
jgi:3-oxoacyl-[acyl-carrier protein] reductase